MDQEDVLHCTMVSCIMGVEAWMRSNRQRLNLDKTEFLWCSISRWLHRIVSRLISLGTILINPAISVCYLGVIMDKDFIMSSHVGKLASSFFIRWEKLNSFVLLSLTTDALKTLVNSLICLEWTSVTWFWPDNLPTASTESNKCSMQQHVSSRTHVKTTILHHIFANYIGFLCHSVWTTDCVWKRAFSYARPSAWNKLPSALKTNLTMVILKSMLEMHLFHVAYD